MVINAHLGKWNPPWVIELMVKDTKLLFQNFKSWELHQEILCLDRLRATSDNLTRLADWIANVGYLINDKMYLLEKALRLSFNFFLPSKKHA